MTRSYTDAHLLSNLLGLLNNDFHESPHELSRHGSRMLMWNVVQAWGLHRLMFYTSTFFETLEPLVVLRMTHAFLPVSLLQQLTNKFPSYK